jgi:hypothetical protein
MCDIESLRQSLSAGAPPASLPPLLKALWYDAKGDWDRAHEIAQYEQGELAAWVHAYLHRKEGDLSNAAYWYARAGKTVCRTSLELEWREIVQAL